jgi:hypothetical protein
MRLRDLSLFFAGIVVVPALSGCGGKTLTEEDCKKIDAQVREVWQAEARKAAAAVEIKSEKATAVIKTEGDKLESDWMSECKKDLVGKRADPKEIDCLLSAKTIDEINKCSEQP